MTTARSGVADGPGAQSGQYVDRFVRTTTNSPAIMNLAH